MVVVEVEIALFVVEESLDVCVLVFVEVADDLSVVIVDDAAGSQAH